MNKLTYEQQLERTGSLIYTTVGRSMRPFLRSQEDLVVIERKTGARFSKYDVVLYRRASGKYVLHRIVKVCPDSYTLCGDNCAELEPGITDDQILGVLTAVIRNGQKLDVDSDAYKRKVRLWCALFWPRAAILKTKRLLSRLKKKLKNSAAEPKTTPQSPPPAEKCSSPVAADVGMDTVYLIACALHDCVPSEYTSQDLNALFRFCRQQSITSMVTMALESLWQTVPPEDPEVTKPWQQAKAKAIRKNILLNAERENILQYLESLGCWYMPLKGSLLQYDYPKFGMRQMSDNDILFDEQFDQQIHDFMCNRGYTVELFRSRHHDAYQKAPVYNFEMHRSLFSLTVHSTLESYYADFKRLMIRDENNSFGCHMSDEDFYIYMTAHAYKHFANSGTGIRTLVDTYVFLNKYADALNWDYVEAELQKLEIRDFEYRCRQLSKKIFSEPRRDIPLSDEERKLLGFFLGSGVYGSRENAVAVALEQLQKDGSSGGLLVKIRYFWRRLFPPLDVMVVLDHDLQQHKWKLPLSYAKRLLRAVSRKPRVILNELRYLIKSTHSSKN